jgi:SAM-dependent methyltransferase
MDTDQQWRMWGEVDPYFGVLTDERFSRANIAANRKAFFASGVVDVERFIGQYEATFGPLPRGRALDFGCGVGRLAIPLAKRFHAAVGLDVSPGMLSEAEANAKSQAVENVRFAVSDMALSGAEGSFEWVQSYIVLQHISPDRGVALIRRLLGKVAPGGGCMLHVSVKRLHSMPRRVAYWIRNRVPFANALANLAKGRPIGRPGLQMNEYPLPDVLELFDEAGMPDVMVGLEDHGGVLTARLTAHRRAGRT